MSEKNPVQSWADMTWPELSRDAAEDVIAVLPLAATEQHGPHLPLGTDTMIAEAYLARVRELLPANLRVLFLPVHCLRGAFSWRRSIILGQRGGQPCRAAYALAQMMFVAHHAIGATTMVAARDSAACVECLALMGARCTPCLL